jgi:hypothetical protein
VSTYGDERWRIADQTAAFLHVDRDVCRRAFYKEPLGFVSKVVDAVRSWRDDPDYDPESLIDSWARDEGVGVYDEDHSRGGGLTPIGDIMGDHLVRLALNRPRLDGEFEYHLYLACVRLEEAKLGRSLRASELDRFTRSFNAPTYRTELETIPKELWYELDSELEAEAPTARRKRPPRRRAG